MNKNFDEWDEEQKEKFRNVNSVLEKYGFSLISNNGKPVVLDKENNNAEFLSCKTSSRGEIGIRLHLALAGGAFDYSLDMKERVSNVLYDFAKNVEIAKSVDDTYDKFNRRMNKKFQISLKAKASENGMDAGR